MIFISSSGTKSSAITPDYLLYSATKGATDQLVRVLAKELGAAGIGVLLSPPRSFVSAIRISNSYRAEAPAALYLG